MYVIYCPSLLIEDITQMWQDACHIWKYYIIKCYKILVIFAYTVISLTDNIQICWFVKKQGHTSYENIYQLLLLNVKNESNQWMSDSYADVKW